MNAPIFTAAQAANYIAGRPAVQEALITALNAANMLPKGSEAFHAAHRAAWESFEGSIASLLAQSLAK